MKTTFKNYFLAALIVPALSIGFTACEDDEPDKPAPPTATNTFKATVNMTPVSDGVDLELNTPTKVYTNAFGQDFSVSRLQYLISDLTFNKADGSSFTIEGYHYYDMDDSTTLTYNPSIEVPEGVYSSISFTFGFDEMDNISNAYPELNLINWTWPDMLGGGYHFMRLEGDYDSLGTSKIFRTHMGTARNNTVTPSTFEANHFKVVLSNSNITVNEDFTFNLVMDINQWYEDTYLWDFNVYNAPIMPIYDAQKRLNENGPTVFSMVKI